MAFERKGAIQPERIGEIRVILTSADPGKPGISDRAAFGLSVVYTDEHEEWIDGNLIPHLTAGEITALLGFMATLRQRAADQILPEETGI